jgi:hypothetical protein
MVLVWDLKLKLLVWLLNVISPIPHLSIITHTNCTLLAYHLNALNEILAADVAFHDRVCFLGSQVPLYNIPTVCSSKHDGGLVRMEAHSCNLALAFKRDFWEVRSDGREDVDDTIWELRIPMPISFSSISTEK